MATTPVPSPAVETIPPAVAPHESLLDKINPFHHEAPAAVSTDAPAVVFPVQPPMQPPVAPPQGGGVVSFLERVGRDALKVLTFGEKAAAAAAPLISIDNPALGQLINASVVAIAAAQAAGTSAVEGAPTTANGAQKAALAITSIKPSADAFAQSLGASSASQEATQQWLDGIVLALKAFGVSNPAS